MRKFILISALLLASVSAQAGQSRNLTLASNEEPKAVETSTTETAKTTETVKAEDTKTDATPEASKQETTKAAKKSHTRREGDEAKARRIAARYGVYW